MRHAVNQVQVLVPDHGIPYQHQVPSTQALLKERIVGSAATYLKAKWQVLGTQGVAIFELREGEL